MGIWSSIKRMWRRHDEHLAAEELQREAVGIDLPLVGDKAAVAEASGLGPLPHDSVHPVVREDESEERDG